MEIRRIVIVLTLLFFILKINAQVRYKIDEKSEMNILHGKPIHGNVKSVGFYLNEKLYWSYENNEKGKIASYKRYRYAFNQDIDNKLEYERLYEYSDTSDHYKIMTSVQRISLINISTKVEDTLVTEMSYYDTLGQKIYNGSRIYVNENQVQAWLSYHEDGKLDYGQLRKYDEHLNEIMFGDSTQNQSYSNLYLIYSYEYNEWGNIKRQSYFTERGGLSSITTVDYDNQQRIIKTEEIDKSGQLLALREFKYNEKGLLKESLYKTMGNTIRYYYEYEYDEKGNWIMCGVDSRSFGYKIYERKIDYYNSN